MIAGLLLAAGAGRRAGGPKALRRFEDGEAWVTRAARVLRDGGCDPVVVVVGAGADAARPLVPAFALVVEAPDWAEGMGASLRTGLAALGSLGPSTAPGSLGPSKAPGSLGPAAGPDLDAGPEPDAGPDAVLVQLVDVPGVPASVVARVRHRALTDGPEALVRAAYDGEPGHPVVLGRVHWAGAAASARGDRGARDYLQAHHVELVECGDLGIGQDLDDGLDPTLGPPG